MRGRNLYRLSSAFPLTNEKGLEMASKKSRRNIYQHSIDLKPLKIPNAPRDEFRKRLEKIPYRGYEVEQISDGRKIVIAKPGGKRVYGQTKKKEDFFVFVYEPTLWQITHKQIYEDIKAKADHDPELGLLVIKCLERVYRGEEPDDILSETGGFEQDVPGEPVELLLKAYKWIWGQEDVNYPSGKGRDMSMGCILELKAELEKQIQEKPRSSEEN